MTRSCSLEDRLTRSATFHGLTQTTDRHHEEEGSPRQRRITVGDSGNIIWPSKLCYYIILLFQLIRNTTLQEAHLFFFVYFAQHPICLILRIRMETFPRRYCKSSKPSLQGGISTQPRAAAIIEYTLFIFPSSLDLSKQ